MSSTDAVVAAIGLVCFGLPILLVALGVRRLARDRGLLRLKLAERGPVYSWDIPLVLGIIIFGGGAVLGGAGIIPLLVWIFDGDTEARRVFIGLIGVFAIFGVGGVLTALPGMRLWIIEETQLTVWFFNRERHLPFGEVTEIRELRSVTGAIGIFASDRRFKIPKQIGGFEDFFRRMQRTAPQAKQTGRKPLHRKEAEHPTTSPTSWSVQSLRTNGFIGFLTLLFVFFVTWPWFVVTGEHPIRDSFFFVGLGLFLWLILAFLAMQESFQKDQPAQLELLPRELRWRAFRNEWTSRPDTDILSVSVETDITYVKGMAGYRYPLVISFVDGTTLRIDDFRAKHLGSSTTALASQIRHHFISTGQRTASDQRDSNGWIEQATLAESAGDLPAAADLLRRAIAAYPTAAAVKRYSHLGDLYRRVGEHRLAVSCYRARLDFASDDASAWEGVAASLKSLGREDLATEAIDNAQRLLLHQ